MYENIKEITNNVVMRDYPKLLKVKNFMVGGVVSYQDSDDGTYLLRKETLDKMMPSIEGRPVVIDHQEVNLDNLEDKAVGYVTKGWFNPDSGQFDCEILVKDSDVYDKIKMGDNKVSSAYICSDFGQGGRYLGQEYDAEILNGTFTHLAIVDNPRYPDAKILVNSLKGNDKMKLFKTKPEETDKIVIDGNEVELVELINAYKERLNACKNEEEEKENEVEEKEEVKEEVKENEDKADEEKENACKNEDEKENEEKEEEKENEDKEEKENEDKEEEKKNEDADNDLISKIEKVVARMLKAKDNEDKEEVKENRNALALKNSYYNPSAEEDISKRFMTRAERIKEGNKNYSKE